MTSHPVCNRVYYCTVISQFGYDEFVELIKCKWILIRSSFFPSSAGDWKKTILNLNPGLEKCQLSKYSTIL